MSVHSEYSRTLEALIDRLKALDHAERDPWIEALHAARVSAHPDLSSAARAAREVLAVIDRDQSAAQISGLVEPRERLEAHARAILGE